MNAEQIARNRIVSAACRVASTLYYTESHEPGPYDDAQREMDDDILKDHLHQWAEAAGYVRIENMGATK